MPLLLGIDLGTSYFKVGLFTPAGELRGLGRVPVTKRAPRPGWSELDVEQFWSLLRRALDEALAAAGASAAEIVGGSFASQANTFVLLDASDRPLTPLVVWNDRRAAPLAADIEEFGRRDAFQARTGFRGLAPEFAAVKCRWYQQHEPAIWARVKRIMTLGDYLTFVLTGERASDGGTAAFTGLFSPTEIRWWPEALEFFGLSAALLNAPRVPGTRVGSTIASARERLGLPAGVPFAVGSIDHHAAAIGAGVGRHADASISTGTVSAALCLLDQFTTRAGCFHGPHTDGRYFRLAFDGAGAGQLEEYQRTHAPDIPLADLVRRTSVRGDPHGQAIRRLMQQIAEIQRSLLLRMGVEDVKRGVAATGGGARSADWLQISANVFEAPVVSLACTESACMGAAIFAAVASGQHATTDDAAAAMVRVAGRFEPAAR